jgi:hypothetical protein
VPARQGTGRERGAPGAGAVGALTLLGLLIAAAAGAEAGGVRITGLEPARTDSTITCTVLTLGLPDGPSHETLASGLPSSLTLTLALLDVRGRERAGATAEVRIEPDPWERTLVVRWPGGDYRVDGLGALGERLRRIGPVTIVSTRGLDPRETFRVRARLAVHALAPAESQRAHAMVMGDLSANGADRREVSAGLGSLLHYFLGRAPAGGWNAQATSAPFDVRTIGRAP